MVTPVFESAHDAESGLRLLQVSGRWDVPMLFQTAPQDPTLAYMADCVTIVDLRGMDFSASPGEIEELATARRARTDAPFEDRYAWITDSPRTEGIALLFGRMVGAGRIRVFRSVEEALAHFDLDGDAYLRTQAALKPVE